MTSNTVVPKARPLDEDEFHSTFLVLLARINKAHGAAKVAQALGYTTKRQLTNLASGSLPSLLGYYNLLVLDQSAHDELDREYGARKVPVSALCTSDPVAAKMAALLTRAIEAESPDSPGGTAVILQEILRMDEAILRDVHRRLGGWIDQIDEARKPRIRSVT